MSGNVFYLKDALQLVAVTYIKLIVGFCAQKVALSDLLNSNT